MNKWVLILLALCVAGLGYQNGQIRQQVKDSLAERDQQVATQQVQIDALQLAVTELSGQIKQLRKETVSGMADQAGEAIERSMESLKQELEKAREALEQQMRKNEQAPQAESDNDPV